MSGAEKYRRLRSDEEAEAMFQADNEIRRIEDPDFKGSVWDRSWETLQPYCRNLYIYGRGY